jgi:hypothetical protein
MTLFFLFWGGLCFSLMLFVDGNVLLHVNGVEEGECADVWDTHYVRNSCEKSESEGLRVVICLYLASSTLSALLCCSPPSWQS